MQPTSTSWPVRGCCTRLGRTMPRMSASRFLSFGSSGLWSLVRGMLVIWLAFPPTSRPAADRPTTARESPTQPVVSCRPLGVCSRMLRMAVDPEKRQSTSHALSAAAVSSNARMIACSAEAPVARPAAAPASRFLKLKPETDAPSAPCPSRTAKSTVRSGRMTVAPLSWFICIAPSRETTEKAPLVVGVTSGAPISTMGPEGAYEEAACELDASSHAVDFRWPPGRAAMRASALWSTSPSPCF
mmetsp:Transcript_52362/g.117628  ORF Transcript_52362/g.117628 Transcript_52362/m.117628 type:complete len:243 (+) Transcript_52362:1192-1920(+)